MRMHLVRAAAHAEFTAAKVARAVLRAGSRCERCSDRFCPEHGALVLADAFNQIAAVLCAPCFRDVDGTLAWIEAAR